ncbi:hypothetical protein ABNF97_04185 [Plantactinospora sp. B6F1]|uniref:hypothetical protein n=1 Tax=Plantactinospora sp. B6F1 TaxID=3158971 RepID=UPI0032D979D6
MTGGQFGEVDLDLLADYVGGALDGTPEQVEVARLIEQDPAWAEAHTNLTAGLDAVRLDLAGWAADPTPMPAAVLDRLTSALAGATVPRTDDPTAGSTPVTDRTDQPLAGTEPGAVTRSGAGPDAGLGSTGGAGTGGPTRPAGRPRRQLSTRPARSGGGPGRPGRRRRWARRLAGPVLLATVVVGFAGFAVRGLVDGGVGARDDSASTALNSGEDAAAPQILGSGPPRTVVEPSAERVLFTGTDYTPDSLPDTVSELTEQAASTGAPTRSTPPARSPDPARQDADRSPATAASSCCQPMGTPGGSLQRLADRSVLAACLDAIAVAHAQGPVAVDLVDYATFQGRAALVVVFTDGSGTRWAWVTGPACGSPGAGADLTYQSRVG